jgi:hypothetical protein
MDPVATAFHRRLDENSAFITALRGYFVTADVHVPLKFIDSLSNLADATIIFTIYFGFDYFSARNLINSLQAQYGTLEEGVDDDLSGNSTYPASIAESGRQGYMGDTATMSTPCAEEVTVAERKAAFNSSVGHDTRSQSGAIEEGVEDDLPGNITPPAAIAGQGYIPLGATPPDPDPPRAIVPPEMRLVNCDIPGHPPWLCDAICHLPSSVCKAAPNYEWLDFARTCRPPRQQVSLSV